MDAYDVTAGAALSIFISPPVVTAKLHTGFLGKILNNVKKKADPRFINTDKAPAYGRALALPQTRRPVPV